MDLKQIQAEVALTAADGDPNVAIEILMTQKVTTINSFYCLLFHSYSPYYLYLMCCVYKTAQLSMYKSATWQNIFTGSSLQFTSRIEDN